MKLPKVPIFILGCPRSGTTLMRLMLNNHPDISIPDETNIFHVILNFDISQINKNIIYLSKILGEEVVINFLKKPPNKKRSPKDILDLLFEKYAKNKSKKYWGEKTPSNIKYIKEIKKIYPNSTIICMVRDPRAVVASCKRYANKKDKCDFWISKDLSKSIKMWKYFIKEAILNEDNITYITYEKLVLNPVFTLKNLCKLINIPYSSKMLDYYKNAYKNLIDKRKKYLVEWHKEVTKKINKKNIDKWKNELSKEEIKKIENELNIYFDYFGYKKMF